MNLPTSCNKSAGLLRELAAGGIDIAAFGVLYYFINSANVDDGNAKGSTFLPTPEMQPMRLPCELRYRLDDSVSLYGSRI